MAGPYQSCDSFSLFKVYIDLTEQGLGMGLRSFTISGSIYFSAEHIADIAVIMYQYLKLVLESGIQEWIFEEVRKGLPTPSLYIFF